MDAARRSLLLVGGGVLAVAVAACSAGAPSGRQTAPMPEATSTPEAAPRSEATSSTGATSIAGTPGTTSAATTGGTAGAASAECTVKDISARLVPGSPGAGQRYASIVLVNTSGRPCVVRGYGGMQLLAANGADVPTRLHRDPQPAPEPVLLPPGKSASSLLHWTVIPSADEPQPGACEPEAAKADVTPPDETHSITVKWDLGPVCGHGRIEQRAYVRGP